MFYGGTAWSDWSPSTIDQQGIGGSETALVRVAEVLAARGWPVEVYFASFEGEVNGVTYRPHDAWRPDDHPAAFVGFRRPDIFDRPIACPVRVFWCHDAHLDDALNAAQGDRMTAAVAVSDWHRELLADRYPFLASKLHTVRNGVSLRRAGTGEPVFSDARLPFADRMPRAVYSSNPGYGLRILLSVWPEIRRRVPGAELHLYSDWDVYDRFVDQNHRLRAGKVLLLHLLAEAEQAGGVVTHGRVGQPELHRGMQQARVWSYTAIVNETSCIGAMEARAAGLAIVTSDLGALPETVGRDRGVFVPLDDEERVGPAFADAVAELLADETAWTGMHARALEGVEALDWRQRGPDWERVLGLTGI